MAIDNTPVGEYFSIIYKKLRPLGFTDSEMYTDSFLGFVVDFNLFHSSSGERVTCIISDNDIQILTYIKETFDEKIIVRDKNAKQNMTDFINEWLSIYQQVI